VGAVGTTANRRALDDVTRVLPTALTFDVPVRPNACEDVTLDLSGQGFDVEYTLPDAAAPTTFDHVWRQN